MRYLILLALIPFSLMAEFFPPDQVNITTPRYDNELTDFEPALGRYTYEVSWSGISAAKIYVDVAKSGFNYSVTTSVRTNDTIDFFYKLRYEANGLMSHDYKPIRSTCDFQENSRIKYSLMEFSKDGKIHSIRKQKNKADEEFNFDPKNFMTDPFSATFLARGLNWKVGDKKSFDTFNGKTRYLVEFTAVDKTVIDFQGEPREVWVLEPKIERLNDTVRKEKLRSAYIYITTDSKREVLKIKSEVFVGNVNTNLIKFEPAKVGPAIVVAANPKILK